MEIELKNVKFYAAMTQETHCFRASLYLNGVRRGWVLNEGHGGANVYSDPTAEAELNAYGETLPVIKGDGYEFHEDADILVCKVMNVWLRKRYAAA
jgi:hypothetical protein